MFEITTAQGFFKKAVKDYQSFTKNEVNSCAAMNCILSLYHLHEWVWYGWLESNVAAQEKFGIQGKKGSEGCKAFRQVINNKCPHFDLLRKLANGTKHCRRVNGDPETEKVAGFGRGPFGVGPFSKPYLIVYLEKDTEGKEPHVTVFDLLKQMVEFWKKFFSDNNIRDSENDELNCD